MTKPSLPQGTRDFSPTVVRKRQFIFSTLKKIFELHGFDPIETPAIENLNTLMGKYGEEGDKLLFKILNNGLNEPNKHDKAKTAFENVLNGKSDSALTERALKYDLTIPFARYLAMNQNDIAFPFRRYQMQPVWRADRPQKGRYREFWQCDCDIAGSPSLINEAELLSIYQTAFSELKIPQICIKINNRKILAALAEWCGAFNEMTAITTAIDKIDKIGWDGVQNELIQRNLPKEAIDKIKQFLDLKGNNQELIEQLKKLIGHLTLGAAGIEELEQVLNYHQALNNAAEDAKILIDTKLARGLNYYTGLIVEVVTQAVAIGSIGGGGRYDNLTDLFGLKNVTGVGISFGIDRIFDVMEELNVFPPALENGTKVFLINLGNDCETQAIQLLQKLRQENITAEIYPDVVKFDKQMKYAHKRQFENVIIIGEEELKQDKYALKNFITGIQNSYSLPELITILKN